FDRWATGRDQHFAAWREYQCGAPNGRRLDELNPLRTGDIVNPDVLIPSPGSKHLGGGCKRQRPDITPVTFQFGDLLAGRSGPDANRAVIEVAAAGKQP